MGTLQLKPSGIQGISVGWTLRAVHALRMTHSTWGITLAWEHACARGAHMPSEGNAPCIPLFATQTPEARQTNACRGPQFT